MKKFFVLISLIFICVLMFASVSFCPEYSRPCAVARVDGESLKIYKKGSFTVFIFVFGNGEDSAVLLNGGEEQIVAGRSISAKSFFASWADIKNCCELDISKRSKMVSVWILLVDNLSRRPVLVHL